MPDTSDYICTGCDYRACVVGGEGQHGSATVVTISCETCIELMDVPVRRELSEPALGMAARSFRLPIHCRRNFLHVVTRWDSGGTCPRCQGQMERAPAVKS
jgi:hypothetical protein